MLDILEDVQQRLIFRCQTFVLARIENFRPSNIDLDYPNKLRVENNEGSNLGLSRSLIFVNERNEKEMEEEFVDWYPTLRSALIVLSKLYRCVNVIQILIEIFFFFDLFGNIDNFFLKKKRKKFLKIFQRKLFQVVKNF